MVEAREEETWVEEVEAWAEKVSQLLPFLVSSLVAPVGFFGVSFGYPFLLVENFVVVCGLSEVHKTLFLLFCFLFLLYLKNG